MKILFLLMMICCQSLYSFAQSGKVGIGINTPKALLHVADSNVLFTGPTTVPNTTNYDPPASGAGSRMMWYPQKSAFRVGSVNGSQWDKDNIGLNSYASGYNTIASGPLSTSMGNHTNAVGLASTSLGYFTNASGRASTSMGNFTNAVGSSSTSMGDHTIASEYASTSMGNLTNASGPFSTSMGDHTNAFGLASTSMGYYTNAGGTASTSMGEHSNAFGRASTSMGEQTKARSNYSLVIGRYNDTSNTNRLFEIGNGTANNARSNAMTVLVNGNVGIGNSTPQVPLQFANTFGTKISLYQGTYGHVGLGIYGGELRLQNDIPNGKVSLGVIETTGAYTELAQAQRNGAIAFTVQGSVWANGTTYASDERFKLNITDISSPLQKLLQIEGVEYEMNTKQFPQYHFTPGRQIGLLAQNVETVIPEAVNEKDGYKGVDYARLVPLLIESIKALKKENDDQKKRIEILEQSLLKQ